MSDLPDPATLETGSPTGPTRSPSSPIHVTVAGHELTVFAESMPLLTSMLLDIRAATIRVWLETYILLDDSAGQAIGEVLKLKAREGLETRVLYDAIGSQATPEAFFEDLRRAGVHVHCFHSLGEAFWRFSFLRVLNRRNHRKLLVIDDRVAYFGGMNIADTAKTMAVARAEHLPWSAGWRDVHLRLVGPRQADIADSLDRSWRKAHGERVPRRPKEYRQALLAQTPESLQFFDSGPGAANTRASRLFTRLIQNARSQLAISMAYFLPVGAVLRSLTKAPRRGVRVRVVVPGESDVPVVQRAARHIYDRLLRRRFRIYERQINMLHSKVMVVDDEWSVVGSCNLDARSLWINLEFTAVIRSRELARALTEIVNYEIGKSRRITLREFRDRSWWDRFLNRLAWAFRWWL